MHGDILLVVAFIVACISSFVDRAGPVALFPAAFAIYLASVLFHV